LTVPTRTYASFDVGLVRAGSGYVVRIEFSGR